MSSNPSSDSSLTELLAVIFAQASGAVNAAPSSLPSSSTAATPADPTASLLTLIQRAQARIQSLSLISSNDSLEDLPTSSLRAVLLNSVYAQVSSRAITRPGDFEARKDALRRSNAGYRTFLSQCISIGILQRAASQAPYAANLAAQVDNVLAAADKSPFPEGAADRRATKIAAMKLERALTTALDEYRNAVRAKHASGGAVRSTTTGMDTGSGGSAAQIVLDTSYDLLVVPQRAKSGRSAGDDDEDGDEDEESEKDTFVGGQGSGDMGVRTPTTLRSYLIMLCHLHAVQALGALDSTYTELQLLQSLPADAERTSQARAEQERAEMERRRRDGTGGGSGGGQGSEDWRLDQRWGVSNDSPILDKQGKPLRPFTILPGQGNTGRAAGRLGTAQSELDARRRLQAQVFQPSHRLPTMTIDEYLEEEQRRGNIIQGGGQASADKLTTKETLALRSEGGQGVGTQDAEEAEEEQRQKAIAWDEFTEANPKGAGNTMNRG